MKLAHRTFNENNWLPSLMDEMLGGEAVSKARTEKRFIPAVNVNEMEDKFHLELVIPGFAKNEVSIEIDKDLLSIASEMESKDETEKGNCTRREFTKSSFKRTFNIPETVNQEGIEADYKNGILTIILPKKDEALPQPKRVIELK